MNGDKITLKWPKVVNRFADCFDKVFSTSKKAHFDCLPVEYKIVDGARTRWRNLLLLDAIIYFLNADEFTFVSRRAFNQQQILYEAIISELENSLLVNKLSVANIYNSSSSSSPRKTGEIWLSKIACLNHRKRIVLTKHNNTQDNTTFIKSIGNSGDHHSDTTTMTMPMLEIENTNYPWDSVLNLRFYLQQDPPAKSKKRYLASVDILCDHPSMHAGSMNDLLLVVTSKAVLAIRMYLEQKTQQQRLITTPSFLAPVVFKGTSSADSDEFDDDEIIVIKKENTHHHSNNNGRRLSTTQFVNNCSSVKVNNYNCNNDNSANNDDNHSGLHSDDGYNSGSRRTNKRLCKSSDINNRQSTAKRGRKKKSLSSSYQNQQSFLVGGISNNDTTERSSYNNDMMAVKGDETRSCIETVTSFIDDMSIQKNNNKVSVRGVGGSHNADSCSSATAEGTTTSPMAVHHHLRQKRHRLIVVPQQQHNSDYYDDIVCHYYNDNRNSNNNNMSVKTTTKQQEHSSQPQYSFKNSSGIIIDDGDYINFNGSYFRSDIFDDDKYDNTSTTAAHSCTTSNLFFADDQQKQDSLLLVNDWVSFFLRDTTDDCDNNNVNGDNDGNNSETGILSCSASVETFDVFDVHDDEVVPMLHLRQSSRDVSSLFRTGVVN